MKRLVLLLGIVFVGIQSQSQVLSFGVRGGLNANNVELDQVIPPKGQSETWHVFTDEVTMGYHLGLYGRIKVLGFYIQPELLLTTLNTNIRIQEVDNNNGVTQQATEELKINRFDIPIMVGLKFGPARVNAGPIASRNISTNSDLITLDKATWGYQAGIGFDIWKLLLDIKFEGSLSERETTITYKGQDFKLDNRTSQLIVSLGYRF